VEPLIECACAIVQQCDGAMCSPSWHGRLLLFCVGPEAEKNRAVALGYRLRSCPIVTVRFRLQVPEPAGSSAVVCTSTRMQAELRCGCIRSRSWGLPVWALGARQVQVRRRSHVPCRALAVGCSPVDYSTPSFVRSFLATKAQAPCRHPRFDRSGTGPHRSLTFAPQARTRNGAASGVRVAPRPHDRAAAGPTNVYRRGVMVPRRRPPGSLRNPLIFKARLKSLCLVV
jgi:hypothetical protein